MVLASDLEPEAEIAVPPNAQGQLWMLVAKILPKIA